jgi:hypothetical protein
MGSWEGEGVGRWHFDWLGWFYSLGWFCLRLKMKILLKG